MKTGHRTDTDRPRRDGHERTEVDKLSWTKEHWVQPETGREEALLSPVGFLLDQLHTQTVQNWKRMQFLCVYTVWFVVFYHHRRKLTSCVRPSQAYKRLSFIHFPNGRCLFMLCSIFLLMSEMYKKETRCRSCVHSIGTLGERNIKQ